MKQETIYVIEEEGELEKIMRKDKTRRNGFQLKIFSDLIEKIPVGGIVALNFGAILKRKGADTADCVLSSEFKLKQIIKNENNFAVFFFPFRCVWEALKNSEN
ncbi:CLUMA_CG021484, isoform A [Clunio marinus]|uniref:CLUMA_CG021484, isoform A n=1 Tax=Clunio marinus TaxID=568069 RepID=A0A1J1J7T5_9DIPT|nr:CLUMA_CG021484, isoform A [Clunio marinus]